MRSVISKENSVATRARPKRYVLLSVFSLIPSFRYSPRKPDRTGPNHDRLNVMISPLKALEERESSFEVRLMQADKNNQSFNEKCSVCGQGNGV